MRRTLFTVLAAAAIVVAPTAAFAQTADPVCPDVEVGADGSAAALPSETETECAEVLGEQGERERPSTEPEPAVEVLPSAGERTLPRTGATAGALAIAALGSLGAGTTALASARKRNR